MRLFLAFTDNTQRSFLVWAQLAKSPKTLVYSPSGQGYVAPPTYTFPASLPAGTAPEAIPDCYVPVIRDTGPGQAGDQCRVWVDAPMPVNDAVGLTVFDASTGEVIVPLDPVSCSGVGGKTININM